MLALEPRDLKLSSRSNGNKLSALMRLLECSKAPWIGQLFITTIKYPRQNVYEEKRFNGIVLDV